MGSATRIHLDDFPAETLVSQRAKKISSGSLKIYKILQEQVGYHHDEQFPRQACSTTGEHVALGIYLDPIE
jgi:hypothetical protein